MDNLKRLWIHLSKRRQKQFGLILILMIIASISEVISLGAVLPFLGVLTDPEQLFQHQYMQPLISALDITKPNQLILPMTIIFVIAVLLAGIARLTLLYAATRLSFATGADLSINIYRRTLYQNYAVHVARNSSEIINGIITKTNTVTNGILTPVLSLISAFILMIGIILALFSISILTALTALIGFGVLYWGVVHYTRQRLKKNSQCISTQSTIMIKSLQEGLGGIRDVLIDGSQQFYCKLYRNADLPLRRASGDNLFIGASPKYAMEALGMMLIAALAYVMTQQEGGMVTAIPVLGALALGAQRLLPILQQAYSSYSTIKGAKSSFEDILDLLGQSLPEYSNQPLPTPMIFEKELKLKKISFRHTKDTPWILKNLDLQIRKGTCIGFIGTTGSGKSTLLDIVMGLLSPSSGDFFIDNQLVDDKNRRAWQMHIAHVPQNIYLSDNTVLENIAFGIPKNKINHQLVEKAAQQAQISKLINEWTDGYQTIVGEQGARLSGGQRQRIAIARALYKQANVLIFDEATSALDNKTEQSIMRVIEGLGKDVTILIIAHRLTTLKNCDQIIRLGNSHLVKTMDYKDIEN